MHFPVVVNGEPKLVECDFANSADLRIVSAWAKLGPKSDEPAVQDAAEFAGLACKRWRFYRRTGRFAHNLKELRERVALSPEAEIALMFVVRASWHQPSSQLGVCLCRRTWSN